MEIKRDEIITGYPHLDRPWMKWYNTKGYIPINIEQSIADYMFEKTGAFKAKTAINYFGQKIKYEDLFRKCESLAKALTFLGAHKDDRIMCLMPNIPETAYLLYGASMIGAVTDYIDPRPESPNLDISAKKVLDLVRKEKPKLIVCLDMCYVGMIKRIEKDLINEGVRNIVVVSASDSMNFRTTINYMIEKKDKVGLKQTIEDIKRTSKIAEETKKGIKSALIPTITLNEALKKSSNEKITIPAFEPKKAAVIVHTSGTSGMPKAIPLTNENMNAYVEQTEIANMPMKVGDKALHILPYFAAFGLVGVVHGGLCHINELVEVPEFNPTDLAILILKYKPSTIIGPPTWLLSFIDDPILKGKDLSFITMITYGGETMTAKDEVRINTFLEKHNCKAKVTKGHGMSETCGCCSYATGGYNTLGSMGIPMPNTTYAILDPKTKKAKRFEPDCDYIEGELAINSDTVTPGIIDNKEVAKKITLDGKEYLLTNDIAKMYKNGTMFFLERSDRAFMRFDGYKVKPSEIEKIINQEVLVRYCSITPYFDEVSNGFRILATIVLEPGIELSIEEKRQFVENLIDKYFLSNATVASRQIPSRVRIRESMPLTPNSKIDYKKITSEGLNGEEIIINIEESNISIGKIEVLAPQTKTLKR